MDNQYKKPLSYPILTAEQIALLNEGKALAEQCGAYIAKLEAVEGINRGNVAVGKTNLQQGFMWATRAIAQPTTF